LAEGLDVSLGRIADAGLKGISLAASYHAGRFLLPHNPNQKVRLLEDGAVYFRPRPHQFRDLVIQPRVTELADSTDPLAAICRAAERHGLEVVAWTVCCHNSFLGEHHPDLVIRNSFGDRYTFALCPAQPDVQAFLEALLHALSEYPLRFLQLESCEYMGFQHGYHHEKLMLNLSPVAQALMGLCFCPACQRAAEERGIDFGRIREGTQRFLEAAFEGEPCPSPSTLAELSDVVPGLGAYLQMRDRIVTDLLHRLSRSATVPLSLLGTGPNLEELASDIGEVTACAYQVSPEEVAQSARAARAAVGPAVRLAVGLEANPITSPTCDNLVAKVHAAWGAGADGLYVYNYGLMPLRSLGWLREALTGQRA
jgi:hypothetical protein